MVNKSSCGQQSVIIGTKQIMHIRAYKEKPGYSNENSQTVLSRGVIYFSLLHENNLLLFSFWFETLYEIEWMTQKQVRG